MHGIAPLDGLRVEFAGRTDAAIVRDLLVMAGVDGDEADARWPEVMDAAVAAYEELCPPDLSAAGRAGRARAARGAGRARPTRSGCRW